MNDADDIKNPHRSGTFEWHNFEAERKKNSTEHAFVWAQHPYLWDSHLNRPYSWPEGQAHLWAAAFILLSGRGNYVQVELCRDYYRKKQQAAVERQERGKALYDSARENR